MTGQRHRTAGFTLIEVLIAMFVIALGFGALLSALTSSTESVSRLRDKSFAGWIALNQISLTRLGQQTPGVGETSGEVDYAGTKWTWRQEIVDPGVAGMLRVNMSVSRGTTTGTTGTSADAKVPALETAYGFIGTGVGAPNGLTPVWNLPPAPAPGSPQAPGGLQQLPGFPQVPGFQQPPGSPQPPSAP